MSISYPGIQPNYDQAANFVKGKMSIGDKLISTIS